MGAKPPPPRTARAAASHRDAAPGGRSKGSRPTKRAKRGPAKAEAEEAVAPGRSAAAPKAGARAAQASARREAILAAALDEFAARGFEAARLDDVARRAGIAKGTIYLYFDDKESLFQELIRTLLTPFVAVIEQLGKADLPIGALGAHIADMFVREIYETRRKDVIRLMLAEGRRFPKLAEFYYREVIVRVMAAMREVLSRAAERGEAPQGLAEFPQLLAAPAMIAIIWGELFGRFEPLDVRAMLETHIDLLFTARRPA